MRSVDLNADAGEATEPGVDEPLLDIVTSVNLACGVHAGGPAVMARISALAQAKGVGVGAHPGLREGRTARSVEPAEAVRAVTEQVAAFRAHAGVPLQHVKLHGALYHAAREPRVAAAVAEAVRRAGGAVLVAQAGSPLAAAGRVAGLRVVEEAFLDRAYRADGTLVPRGEPGALITDPAEVARRATEFVRDGQVRVAGGGVVAVAAQTFCIHGDTPGAATLAAAARRAFEAAGLTVAAMGAA